MSQFFSTICATIKPRSGCVLTKGLSYHDHSSVERHRSVSVRKRAVVFTPASTPVSVNCRTKYVAGCGKPIAHRMRDVVTSDCASMPSFTLHRRPDASFTS